MLFTNRSKPDTALIEAALTGESLYLVPGQESWTVFKQFKTPTVGDHQTNPPQVTLEQGQLTVFWRSTSREGCKASADLEDLEGFEEFMKYLLKAPLTLTILMGMTKIKTKNLMLKITVEKQDQGHQR